MNVFRFLKSKSFSLCFPRLFSTLFEKQTKNKFKKNLIIILIFSLSISFIASSQNGTFEIPTDTDTMPLPFGYSTVQLGMSLEDVKEALLRDPDFGYRGDRDVSLLPGENRSLIETSGGSFLDNCWFQFYDDYLYIISINVNQEFMDYYSIFSTLCKKYGNPNYLDPEKATWEDEDVILSLEKPLCLKYTDAQISGQILEETEVQQATIEYLRQGFLDSL